MTFSGSHDSHSIEREVKLRLFGPKSSPPSQGLMLEDGGCLLLDPSPRRAFQGRTTHLFTDVENTHVHCMVSGPDLGCP